MEGKYLNFKVTPTDALTARRWHVLLLLRYVLPLVTACTLVVLGAFYNVYGTQAGRPMRLSVWRLLFSALKNAREYLLGTSPTPAVRNFYILLLSVSLVLILLFLASVVLSAFALYTVWRVKKAREQGERQEEKRAKILLCTFLPNRKAMAFSNLLLLPLAFFPEVFSLISAGQALVQGRLFSVRCNVTAVVAAALLLLTVALSLFLWRRERDLGMDLYCIEEEGQNEENLEK